jgi:hypothetical protein
MFITHSSCLLLLFALVTAPAAHAAPPPVRVTPFADRVRIEIDGKLFTDYIFKGAPKPYLYPVVASDGTRLTRDYPMADTPGEERDHPHQRSLWFAHGDVNGHDFWTEENTAGTIVHEALLETKSGTTGRLRARNRWVARDGTVVCTDETTVRVTPVPHGSLLDYEVTLQAPPDTVVTLGDTKEGTMALRLASWMTIPHPARRDGSASGTVGAGHAVNSAGDRDTAAWGKRAAWVDYSAPHGGKVYGVAFFDHPKNPRHPTWWHVRDYGLFAANPFGRHDFERLTDQPKAGELVVPAGGQVTWRYRLYFHDGQLTPVDAAERYRDYAQAAESTSP